jgi:hypothetical protein
MLKLKNVSGIRLPRLGSIEPRASVMADGVCLVLEDDSSTNGTPRLGDAFDTLPPPTIEHRGSSASIQTSYSGDSEDSAIQTIEAMPAFPTPPDTVPAVIASPTSSRSTHKHQHHGSINSIHSIHSIHSMNSVPSLRATITDTLYSSPAASTRSNHTVTLSPDEGGGDGLASGSGSGSGSGSVYRSRVSMDVTPLDGTAPSAAEHSTRSVSPMSTHSRLSHLSAVQRTPIRRRLEFNPVTVEMEDRSAVTPRSERHAYFDDEDDEDQDGYDGYSHDYNYDHEHEPDHDHSETETEAESSTAARVRHVHMDAALRSAPGVVGIGEGWAGGPRRKKKKAWWKRQKATAPAEADPLALWSVPEEGNGEKRTQSQGLFKEAWNRSKRAFGSTPALVNNSNHESKHTSKHSGTRPDLVSRARGLFSRSRLNLAAMEDDDRSRTPTGPRFVDAEKTKKRHRHSVMGLFNRSQGNLPTGPKSAGLSSSPSMPDLSGSERRRLSVQPRAIPPRAASLRLHSLAMSSTPNLSYTNVAPGPGGLPPPWRPGSLLAAGRPQTPFIPEVSEPSESETSLVTPETTVMASQQGSAEKPNKTPTGTPSIPAEATYQSSPILAMGSPLLRTATFGAEQTPDIAEEDEDEDEVEEIDSVMERQSTVASVAFEPVALAERALRDQDESAEAVQVPVETPKRPLMSRLRTSLSTVSISLRGVASSRPKPLTSFRVKSRGASGRERPFPKPPTSVAGSVRSVTPSKSRSITRPATSTGHYASDPAYAVTQEAIAEILSSPRSQSTTPDSKANLETKGTRTTKRGHGSGNGWLKRSGSSSKDWLKRLSRLTEEDEDDTRKFSGGSRKTITATSSTPTTTSGASILRRLSIGSSRTTSPAMRRSPLLPLSSSVSSPMLSLGANSTMIDLRFESTPLDLDDILDPAKRERFVDSLSRPRQEARQEADANQMTRSSLLGGRGRRASLPLHTDIDIGSFRPEPLDLSLYSVQHTSGHMRNMSEPSDAASAAPSLDAQMSTASEGSGSIIMPVTPAKSVHLDGPMSPSSYPSPLASLAQTPTTDNLHGMMAPPMSLNLSSATAESDISSSSLPPILPSTCDSVSPAPYASSISSHMDSIGTSTNGMSLTPARIRTPSPNSNSDSPATPPRPARSPSRILASASASPSPSPSEDRRGSTTPKPFAWALKRSPRPHPSQLSVSSRSSETVMTTTTYLSAPTSPMSPSRKSVSVISSRPNSDGGSTERYEGASMYDEPLDAGEWCAGRGSRRGRGRGHESSERSCDLC